MHQDEYMTADIIFSVMEVVKILCVFLIYTNILGRYLFPSKLIIFITLLLFYESDHGPIVFLEAVKLHKEQKRKKSC